MECDQRMYRPFIPTIPCCTVLQLSHIYGFEFPIQFSADY